MRQDKICQYFDIIISLLKVLFAIIILRDSCCFERFTFEYLCKFRNEKFHLCSFVTCNLHFYKIYPIYVCYTLYKKNEKLKIKTILFQE